MLISKKMNAAKPTQNSKKEPELDVPLLHRHKAL